jgi:hypothetical protein
LEIRGSFLFFCGLFVTALTGRSGFAPSGESLLLAVGSPPGGKKK